MKKRLSWDEERLDRLRQHVLSGGSVFRASVIFKRPVEQHRLRAKGMGCPLPPLRKVGSKPLSPPQKASPRRMVGQTSHPIETKIEGEEH